MKRFDLVTGQTSSWLGEVPDGRFVSFDDHAAEVARLTAALEAAEKDRDDWREQAAVECEAKHEAIDAKRKADQNANSYARSAHDCRVATELAEARAEALQARVAELEAVVESNNAKWAKLADAAREQLGVEGRARHVAEAELATAKARVAELEAAREATLAPEGHGGYLDLVKRANAAESELADLRGRVERAVEAYDTASEQESTHMPDSLHGALEALRGR